MVTDAIIAASALVNLLLIGALVCVTVRYARETKRIAEAARQQAEASVEMARETRKQRLSLQQPLLLPELGDIYQHPNGCNVPVRLRNVGNGPAIKVERCVRHPDLMTRNGGQESSQDWTTLLVDSCVDAGFVLARPGAGESQGTLSVTWKDVHGNRFEYSARLVCTVHSGGRMSIAQEEVTIRPLMES